MKDINQLIRESELTPDDYLVAGKSRKGMYFQDCHCSKCGDPTELYKTGVHFCSRRCEEKALSPYMIDRESFEDYPPFERATNFMDLLNETTEDELEEEFRGEYSRADIRERIDQLHSQAKERYDQRSDSDHEHALWQFTREWTKQRTFLIKEEREKRILAAQNEFAESLEKDRQKRTKERAKQDEIDAEEAKWRPRRFEL